MLIDIEGRREWKRWKSKACRLLINSPKKWGHPGNGYGRNKLERIDANKLLEMTFKKGVSGGASCSSGRLSLQG